MAVNADAATALLQIAHPFLKLAPNYGRVVLIATKNAAAPGPGAAQTESLLEATVLQENTEE